MKGNKVIRFSGLFLLTTILLAQSAAARIDVVGSGASFPYQIYSLWFMLSNQTNKDIRIDYTAKGSGAGIKDFQNHDVDFAASDAAMNDEEISKVKEGVQLLPMTAGEVVLANSTIPENMIVWLSDPAGEKSYPITTYTWMLFYKKYDDPQKAEAMRRIVTYFLDNGQKISDRFGYIPLPENVVERVRTASSNIQ